MVGSHQLMVNVHTKAKKLEMFSAPGTTQNIQQNYIRVFQLKAFKELRVIMNVEGNNGFSCSDMCTDCAGSNGNRVVERDESEVSTLSGVKLTNDKHYGVRDMFPAPVDRLVDYMTFTAKISEKRDNVQDNEVDHEVSSIASSLSNVMSAGDLLG